MKTQDEITYIYAGVLMGSLTGNYMSLEEAFETSTDLVQAAFTYAKATDQKIDCLDDYVAIRELLNA